jgi:hypothetical protein
MKVSLATWAAIAALLFGLAWSGTQINGDGLLYIAHGRFMLEHGALPEVDPFSQSSMHGPLVLHRVLCMLGFAVVDATLGFAWLLPLTALVACVALVGMVRLAGATRLATMAALALVLVLVVIDRELFEVRGQAFAYAPFVAYLVVLRRVLDGNARAVPFALPLVALWANIHPSFVIAIALPLLCLLALVFERPADRKRAPLLGALAAAALLGSFVSPYGPRLVVDVLSLIGDPTTSVIAHMRSPPASAGFLVWLAASLSIVSAYAVYGPRPVRRVYVLVAAALIIATLMSRRYAVFATGFEMMLLGPLLAHRQMARGIVIERALAVIAFACGAWFVQRGAHELHEDLPLEHVAILENARLPDRVLTEFAWGGALMYAWGEQRGVHIDGRNNLYGNGVFNDYLRFIFDAERSLALLDLYEINTVLWPSPPTWALNDALARSPAWRLVYRDEKAALWTRRRR